MRGIRAGVGLSAPCVLDRADRMAAERAPLADAAARHVIGCDHSWRVLAMRSSTSQHDDMGLPPLPFALVSS